MTREMFDLESELGQFLGSYLGQDFDVIYATPWDAVSAYVRERPKASRVIARDQLRQVLDDCESEAELSSAMDHLYMNLYPPGMGMTYRAWLEKVELYLAEHEH